MSVYNIFLFFHLNYWPLFKLSFKQSYRWRYGGMHVIPQIAGDRAALSHLNFLYFLYEMLLLMAIHISSSSES